MDFTTLHSQLEKDFRLGDLPDGEKQVALLEVAKTIQKQFLLDVYDLIGEEKFEALQTSSHMGDDFYTTTLKHLVPSYEDIFLASRMKIINAFHKELGE